jgi:hypothetical protein
MGGSVRESFARAAWRKAVADVAERARAALPECNGRVESAVKLVLAGDVTLHDDGTATVASGSEPETTYTVNGTCACPDFVKAPHGGMCKHRIAYGLALRAQQLVSQKVQALDSQAEQPEASQPAATPPVASVGLPEAPASANCYIDLHGRKVQVTLRGTDENEVLAKMARLLARYPLPEATAPTQEKPEGWCAVHDCQMYWNDPKPGDTRPGWWSHKAEDGTWCKGKPRKPRR